MSSTSGIRNLYQKVSRANVGVPLLFVMLLLWINGVHWWGPYWEESTALAYIIMMLVALRTAEMTKNRRWWLSSANIVRSFLNFWVVFLAAFAVMLLADLYVFGGELAGVGLASAAIYPTFALHAFFVAPVEESLFRGC